MSRYDAPGSTDDFARGGDPTALAIGWHNIVSGWIGARASEPDDVSSAFFDALDSDGDVVPIAWDAFPLALRTWFATEPDPELSRHQAAETLTPWRPGGKAPRARRDNSLAEPLALFRRQQDEYCEWFTHRDGAGQITRVDFTCEGPEYWTHISEDRQLCLQLYREHVSPGVQMSDLYWDHDVVILDEGSWKTWAKAGDYNILNRWTTTHGAMHLTHEANTLEAEIHLAADATVLRAVDGTLVDDPGALICCSGFGGASRSSDPLIGFGVNRAVSAGKRVGLANPVGLYIADLNKGAFTDDNGDPVDGWQVTRGDAARQRVLRATFTPPDGAPVLVGGIPLTFGGQVTDHIQMVLYGVVAPKPGGAPAPQECMAKCCTHPDRPGFRIVVRPNRDCSQIDWDESAPAGPDTAAGPSLAAADAEDLSDIVVTESAVLTYRR
ncbi:hypothetical protein [Nocardia sp. NPDC050710]|uniref:hypothetical protein n=1 Tax=Nocardia sp. NPDC050710 TaxID=3157220 RepID=UPI0033D52E7C